MTSLHFPALRVLPPSLVAAYLSTKQSAAKSTCKRRAVGCAITYFDGSIAAVGYNSETVDYPYVCANIPRQCGCMHAEVAAASKLTIMRSVPLIAVVTCAPCITCYHALRLVGVKSFWYEEESDPGVDMFELARTHTSVDIQRLQFVA